MLDEIHRLLVKSFEQEQGYKGLEHDRMAEAAILALRQSGFMNLGLMGAFADLDAARLASPS
jgi:hypothetical protein